MKKIILPEMTPEVVQKDIEDFVLEHTGYKDGAVIGLSGGVDSTTSAALIKGAYDRHNAATGSSLELVGYVLPSSTNNPADAEDGVKVAKQLGIRYEVIAIDGLVDAFEKTNPEAIAQVYHKGNLMSRLRANVLHTKGAVENKIVAGTGNKDEDVGVGYYTLFGDGAVQMSPIGGLSKRLVREMATYLGFEDIANREPTAGLEPGQTDFKDLGYSYSLVELVTEGGEQGLTNDELLKHPQVQALGGKDLATYEKVFGASKHASVEDAVKDIFRRQETAVYKASIVSPPVCEVTLDYAGELIKK